MSQLSLFGDLFDLPPAGTVPAIDGLRLIGDWVDPAEEHRLLAAADGGPWLQHYRRRTQAYGGGYRDGRPPNASRLPPWLEQVGARLAAADLLPGAPDQAGINEYLPGQGIAHHRDDPAYAGPIAILSLGSACRFELRAAHDDRIEGFILRPRSLLLLDAAARWDWLHGIPGRKHDLVDGVRSARGRRVSLTFRRRGRGGGAAAARA